VVQQGKGVEPGHAGASGKVLRRAAGNVPGQK
jgi:hypothetical protein